MQRGPASARSRRLAAVIAGALGAHALVIAGLDEIGVYWGAPPDEPAPVPADREAELPLSPGPLDVDVIALLDPAHTPPPMAVWGPGDLAGFAATHPLPNASVDRPGERAAERGGGATGGEAVWTGRRDRLDDAMLLAEPWNDGVEYRAAHDGNARTSSSTEALHRQPDPAAGDRQVQRLAKDGGEVASKGATSGVGAGDGDTIWRDADPRFGLKPGKEQAVKRGGATQPNRDAAFSDQGTASADVTRRGSRTRDSETVAAASAQTAPDPFDLTPAQSGGTDRGVDGDRGKGALADGTGRGEGATRADATSGARDLAIKARPQDPYFRALYARLGKEVQFPQDLALDLKSGRVVGAFVLAADGGVSDIRLHSSSGFRGFDDELLRALRTLTDLGAVPGRLLDGRTELRILVPFEFKNPIVR
jgi:TonB family protein